MVNFSLLPGFATDLLAVINHLQFGILAQLDYPNHLQIALHK